MSNNERSEVSLRSGLPPTYRLDRTLAPAVTAAAELLHAGVLTRFGEDAVIEGLIARFRPRRT